eukprot:653927-Rhodomonas_salina.2
MFRADIGFDVPCLVLTHAKSGADTAFAMRYSVLTHDVQCSHRVCYAVSGADKGKRALRIHKRERFSAEIALKLAAYAQVGAECRALLQC